MHPHADLKFCVFAALLQLHARLADLFRRGMSGESGPQKSKHAGGLHGCMQLVCCSRAAAQPSSGTNVWCACYTHKHTPHVWMHGVHICSCCASGAVLVLHWVCVSGTQYAMHAPVARSACCTACQLPCGHWAAAPCLLTYHSTMCSSSCGSVCRGGACFF